MEQKKPHILIGISGLVLGLVVIVLNIVYLFTEWMIPGLLPICQALLMIPMFLLWKDKKPRWIAILFALAAVLNVIAAVLQIFFAH